MTLLHLSSLVNYPHHDGSLPGPGIPDVARVLSGGYSTSKGLGLGISGSRRLMDEFELRSVVGEGTTIEAVKLLQ
jgi:serine/threonine-protein kinase RsbT